MSKVLDLGVIHEPLLIFGGPYSNRQATEAIKTVAEQRGIPAQRVICTGDVVAYCAEPEATTCVLRDWGIQVVMGNCEQALAADAGDCGCGFAPDSACEVLTDSWYPFAVEQLSAESKTWMGTLPSSVAFTIQSREFLVVHGSVSAINRFIFFSTSRAEKRSQLALAAVDCVIGGHCGLPFGEAIDGQLWLNAGAIGIPANDGSQDGWYLLLEPAANGVQISWQRLRYDAAAAYAAMQAAGLHNGYADALLSGLWPSLEVLPERERQQQGRSIVLPTMSF